MNLNTAQLNLLHQGASGVIDCTLSDEDFANLSALLESSEEARRFYAEYMYLQATLLRSLGDSTVPAIVDEPPARSMVPLPFRRLATSVVRRVPGGETTVGVLVVLVLVAAFWGLSQAILHPNLGGFDVAGDPSAVAVDRGAGVGRAEQTVAQILNSENLQWSTHREASLPPAIRLGERMQIESGLVELQLGQGTTLLIEGPADWKIDGANAATLERGKLVAKVPPRAIGFTLNTRHATIVDLGTEFGVSANGDAAGEVVVFLGKVDVRGTVSANAPAPRPVRVEAGQKLALAAITAGVSPVGTLASSFQRRLHSKIATNAVATGDIKVLAWYRLGDDDGDIHRQLVAPTATLANASASFATPLALLGQPAFTSATFALDSRKALRFGPNLTAVAVAQDIPPIVSNFVLEAWVRPRSSTDALVAYFGNSGGDGFGLRLVDGKWAALFGGQVHISSEVECKLDAWTHLAVVRADGISRIYVNGKRSAATWNAEPHPPTRAFAVGGHAAGTQTFDGAIDEVRLWRFERAFDPQLFWPGTGSANQATK